MMPQLVSNSPEGDNEQESSSLLIRGKDEVEAIPSLYCELCNKQYERQQEYDNHTSSYDHHHRQRLKELKQREFYRLLGSRRQRKGRDQTQQHVSGTAHRAAGLGPMFRSTTVALDMSTGDPELLTSYTEEPVTSQSGSSGNPHLWSETRVRPVCFTLPKRCSTLCHQSAAAFRQASKERKTQTSDDVDHIYSTVDPADSINHQSSVALKPTQEKPKIQPDFPKNTFSCHVKEPFCRVLSRDSATVLLWPSEMISYTRTAPSISFSVNPLLHNFRAGNTTPEVPVDKRTELEKSEPSVIKQAEQQQRQADALGRGAPSRHERDRVDGCKRRASAAELVAYCNSSYCDESALNLPTNSKIEKHLVLSGKKQKRKRTKRVRRGMRRKKKEITKQRARPCSREEGPGRENNSANTKEIRKDQAASSDHKRAELLSHLPVSHFNRCNQLCAQVNSQASLHPSQQSVSEWCQGFRKLHSRGAGCSPAISLVPGSDIEIPRCPAITPWPAQSCTDVWEAHAERQRGENSVVKENAAKEQILEGKRTFDEAFKQETLCCQAQNVPAVKNTVDHTSLHCDAITEHVTIALTSSKSKDATIRMERPQSNELKKVGGCVKHSLELMCISSNLNVQENSGPEETQKVKSPTNQINMNTSTHCVSRCSLCVEEACITTCSCCHSISTHRAMEKCATNCRSYQYGEFQNTASEENIDGCKLIVKNIKNQTEETHCMTSVSKTLTDLGSADTLGCQFDCTNHFTNCNCTEKDTNDGVVNIVLISTHSEQQKKEDKMKHVPEKRKEEKMEENRKEEGNVQERRKMDRSDRMMGEWACFPLPPPYPLNHTYLHQQFVPLSQPMPRYPLFTSHLSTYLPLLPPLLPVAPVPLLDHGPYPQPAFASIQSGILYSPMPPPLVPTQFIFSKSVAFSIS